MNKVELLAPAGSKESFYYAINAGCDAVYLGGLKFGARSYANNFSLEELSKMLTYARIYGVKVYCTVNTVIFEDELEEVIDFVGEIHKLGIDGVLVQDYGLLNILHQIYPNLTLHASTQMNITTLEEVRVLKELGVKRVVLARETSLDEIKKIKSMIDIEVEVFVHGAICISYSGNCYMSSVITKRSGNRGKCSGSCRLEYRLTNDNGTSEEFNYPLSPKDLLTIDHIGELIEAGVDSLKIEGRMKRPEYVGQVVSSYKKAINNYYYGEEIDYEKEEKELKYIFNRGFTKGFLFKEKNSLFINSKQPNHIGVLVGKVIKEYPNKTVDIKLNDKVEYLDSLRLVGKATDAITINQVKVGNELLKIGQVGQIINVKVHEKNLLGANVYKTTDNNQLIRMSKLTTPQIEINGEVYLENQELILVVTDGVNTVTKRLKFDDVAKSEYNSRIISQINKTGNMYKFINLENKLDQEVFVQISKINELRRNALDELSRLRGENKIEFLKVEYDFPQLQAQRSSVHLSCRVRTLDQLEAVLNSGIKMIYICDYKLYNEYKSKVGGDIKLYYYPPRVGNNHKINNIVTSRIDRYNSDSLVSVYANCCNSYTLRSLAQKSKQIGLSIELDYKRLKHMLENFKNKYQSLPDLEMMVYGRYELMVMKYCLIHDKIIKQSDKTKDKLYCNECLNHQYSLVDKGSYSFPLIKEENCNLKILNSKITNLINYLKEIVELGVNSLLIDFSTESSEEVNQVLIEFKDKLTNLDKPISKTYLNDFTSGHYNEGVL